MVMVVVALDVGSADEALDLADQLRDHVDGFKLGVGLLYAAGPGLIGELGDVGRPVFADAKLHDIPSQVENAARSLSAQGARWITAHAAGGPAMLEAAVGGAGDAGVLAVTVLTSLPPPEPDLIERLAKDAAATGCEGVVSSVHELAVVDSAAPGLLKVTPGIRLAATADDQTRTATPQQAVAAGADLLVVGRPITQAPDPAGAAVEISKLVARSS